MTLSLERLIPEALFRPQDFGIPSAGVAGLTWWTLQWKEKWLENQDVVFVSPSLLEWPNDTYTLLRFSLAPPFNKRSSLLQNSTVHIFPIPSSSKIPSPHPSEVSELVVQAITAVCEVTWRPFLSRLVLCGALARLPGLRQRLQRELRAELPSEWPVELLMEEEPEWSVWQGEGLGWDGEGGDGVFRNLLDVFVCLEVWKG